MPVPAVTFAAWSNTGKTTYLEKLIPCLRAAGLRVAVVKHDGHAFQMDRPGTDTSRLAAAGAEAVGIVSAGQFAWIQRETVPLEALVERITGVDLVLTEGFKRGPYPKIALYREDSGKGLAVEPGACLAIVSDAPLEAPCPVFPLEDPAPLAEFLLRWLKEERWREP